MSNETGIALTSTIQPLTPKHSLSDYFVLILLSVCIAVGAPMSIMICWRLMQRLRLTGVCSCNRGSTKPRRQNSRQRQVQQSPPTQQSNSNLTPSRRTDLLKLQLNFADLMVLIFYAFSKVVWTLTYNWRGGEVLCKTQRFLSVLSFHMCSNSVVCIGLDRMITLVKPLSGNNCRCTKKCAREFVMLGISCCLAFWCSLPQFWIWTVADLKPDWPQCVSIFGGQSGSPKMSAERMALAELYSVFHLLTIFWIPCIIIAISYIVIVVQVLLHVKEPAYSTGTIRGQSTNNYTRHDTHFDERRRSVATIRQLKMGRGLLKCGRLTRFLCRQSLTILTVYIICWGPYNALTLWVYFRPDHALIYRTVLRFLQELIVVNSVINPFLYACDVYHQIVDERTRQDPHSCLCCFFACPCALVEDSDNESIDDL